ncbi:hypothetical protein [Thermospira aquatica]|uniref:PD-(D/E)XK motif protein n=1 Tax=Thermospira aquatica TaxID=2828656 RepID=A0AAX3BEM2_9SPIR|nr:hypothetical protein [Thermospira aquatica]URA10799.1 hypothetical protein KDW03_03060 [Thermospira aquatica]
MTIIQKRTTLSTDKKLFLSRPSYKNSSSFWWIRALMWQGEVYPWEGDFHDGDEREIILFIPENTGELLECLTQILLSQGGGEEIEWFFLGIKAFSLGVSYQEVRSFLSGKVPFLVQREKEWEKLFSRAFLIQKAVQYGISLRLLLDWSNEKHWLTWLEEALDVLVPHGNQLRQIWQGFLALQNGRGWSIQDILHHLDWEDIKHMPDGPAKRLEVLQVRLKHLRYPHLSEYEARLQSLSQTIHKKTGWKLSWPAFLEGEHIVLTIPMATTRDIHSLPEKATTLFHELEEALKILRGEGV